MFAEQVYVKVNLGGLKIKNGEIVESNTQYLIHHTLENDKAYINLQSHILQIKDWINIILS